jgi:hypothetical protein
MACGAATRGADGTARWVGVGVSANNLMSTATVVTARAARNLHMEIGAMKRVTAGPSLKGTGTVSARSFLHRKVGREACLLLS